MVICHVVAVVFLTHAWLLVPADGQAKDLSSFDHGEGQYKGAEVA